MAPGSKLSYLLDWLLLPSSIHCFKLGKRRPYFARFPRQSCLSSTSKLVKSSKGENWDSFSHSMWNLSDLWHLNLKGTQNSKVLMLFLKQQEDTIIEPKISNGMHPSTKSVQRLVSLSWGDHAILGKPRKVPRNFYWPKNSWGSMYHDWFTSVMQ